MRRTLAASTLVFALSIAGAASAEVFPAGSLIIPMDITYQDSGMLSAYGLVYELLRHDIPVNWTIRTGKAHLGADFSTSAVDHATQAVISAHGYRGGPWVVHADQAGQAIAYVDAWHASHPETVVHEASLEFEADVARRLVVAPTIAMFADGNQKIARTYVQAAGIPDSTLNTAWPDTSPDMLTPAEVAGPTTSNHRDGALFDRQGQPVYCQFMSMHWGVSDARANPEVVAEVRSFLNNPVHFFAECQAVNAFENDPMYGMFLTQAGFTIGAQPSSVDFYNDDSPFAQLDGAFQTVGGSEPSYTLAAGGDYWAKRISMITESGTPEGTKDVWMTGYLNGACPPETVHCGTMGKVSYLGGHSYTTTTPISKNPKTQGVRLFLNALFEAPCATATGLPTTSLAVQAPASTTSPEITVTVQYTSNGLSPALSAVLSLPLPSGVTVVSIADGGTVQGGVASWNLGNLGYSEASQVSLVLRLPAIGNYRLGATLAYRVGMNRRQSEAVPVEVLYDQDTDSDGVVDSLDSCPGDANPAQDLQTDIESCGSCGNRCSADHATVACVSGTCRVGGCTGSFADCDRSYLNGCEYDGAGFPSDPEHCGGCDQRCTPAHSTGECRAGSCAVGGCAAGWSDCNGLAEDGCEYDQLHFATDPRHCGSCAVWCESSTPACEGGNCTATTCASGRADCAAPAGDCETDTAADPANCGGCGLTCAPLNATGVCSVGACAIGACTAGFADCNGLPGDGCETPTAGFFSDPNHCGGCDIRCSAPHAEATCTAGACAVLGCAPGWLDCNGVAADGCEHDLASLASDPSHCGQCGVVCAPPHGAGACVAGSCSLGACLTGFVDLDRDPANGCEHACSARAIDDSTCDGVDDDCDGETDDDFVGERCGVGACAASATCVAGASTCTPLPRTSEGPAGDMTCIDNGDNDCDGLVDGLDPDCGGLDGGLPEAGDDDAGPTLDAEATDAEVPVVDAGAEVSLADEDATSTPSDAQTALDQDAATSANQDAPATLSTGGSASAPGATAGSGSASGAQATPAASAAGDEGGCGCKMVHERPSGSRWWLLSALLLVTARRRRSRSRS